MAVKKEKNPPKDKKPAKRQAAISAKKNIVKHVEQMNEVELAVLKEKMRRKRMARLAKR